MAKGKKSFILYCDIIHTFEYLTDEQKGKVFDWILKYVNDLKPEPLEGLLQAVVEPIKRQLKRDLKEYECKIEKRREAGKKGADARWQKIAKDSKRIKPIAKMAVTDTVTDTDIKKKIIPKGIPKKEIFETWLEYRKEIKKPITNGKTLKSLADRFDKESLEACKFVVNLSIENNYQGLFWDKYKSKPQTKLKKGAGSVL